MKRNVLIAAGILIALVAGLLVAPGFIDWSQYKTQIQDQVKTATGLTAELRGKISMAILPSPRVYIEDVQIAAPQGSASDYLLKLGRADIHLALFPLLSGKIDFSSVNLVEPQIALQVMKDGSQNWMTPELKKLTGAGTDNPPQATTPASAPAISLKGISIEKGAFTYRDDSQKEPAAPVAVNDINIDAQADTLKGPFTIDGSFAMSGQTIDIKSTTGQIDANNSVSINASGEVKPGGLQFQYAGVVTTAAPYQAQGETKLAIESLKDAGIDEKLALEGLLTASQEKAEFKNATFALGNNSFTGDLSADLSPIKITGAFKGSDTVNLDKFIKPSKSKDTKLLPETIVLPVPFEAGLKFTVPALVYQGQTYSNVNVLLSKQDKIFAAEFTAGSIPGKGNVDAKAAVKFAAKSVSAKDKSEVYSDPTLVIAAKGETKNVAQTLSAVSGRDDIPMADTWKTATFNANVEVKPDSFAMKDTTLQLDNSSFKVGGSYTAGKRPKLVADIAADTLDLDALQQKAGGGQKTGSLEDTLKSLALPFDLDFNFAAQNAHLQGRDVKGLKAAGTFRDNAVSFTNLAADDFAGAAFKASGGIADLKGLSGVDVTLTGHANDAKEVAKALQIDISSLPASLQKADVTIAAKGTLQKMNVNANIAALNGNLIARGDVDSPLGKMALSNMSVQAKHSNMAEAIQMFSPGAPRYVSLEKPMDVSADIDRQGNTYSLKNMKAVIAGSPMTGTLSVDMGGKPSIKGDLKFDNLSIQSTAGNGGGNSGGGTGRGSNNGGGHWSSETMDTSWMNAMNADIKLQAGTLAYESWNLQNPVIDISLQDGTLDIRQFQSDLFGGKMNVSGTLKAGSGSKGFAAVDTAAKFASVQVEPLVKALTRGNKLIQGTGDVTLDSKISTSGASQAALVSALQGNGTISGNKIVLQGFDLSRFAESVSGKTKPADTLQGLWKGATSGGSTSFDKLDGAFTISQGIVNITKMDMTGQQANLGTQGNLNLPQWTIATQHTITLPQKPDVPPFTIKIAGSLDNPGQSMGQGLLGNYLDQKLGGKLDKVLGGSGLGQQLGSQLLGLPATTTTSTPAPAATTATPAVAPAATAPAAGDTATQAAPEAATPLTKEEAKKQKKQQEKEQKQEAIQGVLKGLLGQ